MGADGEDEVTAARGENHEGHSQIDQSRFSDIGRDELGGRLDGGQEQRKIASCSGPETELISKDMAIVGTADGSQSNGMSARIRE